jgi:hypothetical protein
VAGLCGSIDTGCHRPVKQVDAAIRRAIDPYGSQRVQIINTKAGKWFRAAPDDLWIFGN